MRYLSQLSLSHLASIVPAATSIGAASLAAALAFSAAPPVAGAGAIHGPKIVSEHSPDMHSLEDFVASIVRPGMSQKERAHILWQTMADRMYHWQNPVEAPWRREQGDVTDPIKLLNVYGYTLCFCSGGAMEQVWRAGGLEAREFGVPGHVAAEVWYDGAYRYMDMETKGYYRREDGQIASIRECGLRPVELMVAPDFPPEFFPLSRDPFRTYLSKMVYAGIVDGGPAWYASHRAEAGHVMNVTLRPGESLYRSWDNVGRFVNDFDRWMEPGAFGTFDSRYGPRDTVTGRTFGNGLLVYRPDLTTATQEYEHGVFQDEGVQKTAEGLTVAKGARQGWAVWRVQLPYVIAGNPNRLQAPDDATDAALVEMDAQAPLRLEVSTDNGQRWQDAGLTGSGRVDLSRFVVGRYGYQIRLHLSEGTLLRGLRVSTSIQLAPSSLPAMQRGHNRMTFDLGDAPYEMMEIVPPTWTTEEEFFASVYEHGNIRWNAHWTRAVSAADTSQDGYVIYELKAPPGRRLRRVSVDLAANWDGVALSAAVNQPKEFRSLGQVRSGPYAQHWRRRIFRNIDLSREQDARSLFVRCDILAGADSRGAQGGSAISSLRFRLFFEEEDAGEVNTAGLRVTHGWVEEGEVRTFQAASLTPGQEYNVATGEKFERPLFLCLENIGRAGSIALSDPLGRATYQPRPPEFFPPEAAGYSNAELLLQLDREGLERSDTMVAILTDGRHPIVAQEVAKMLGYRPVEAVRPLLEKLRAEQPEELRWPRGLALLNERKAPSRQAFLREYLPGLSDDAHGMDYIRRIGLLGSEKDIPPLLESIEKVAPLRLKLALVQSALALGSQQAVEVAARLAAQSPADGELVRLDAALINAPSQSAAAADRLIRLLEAPQVRLRWEVVDQMAVYVRPGGPADVVRVARKALADESPYIRLGGLMVLSRAGKGEEAVRAALAVETEPFLAEAYREFLAAANRQTSD